MTAQGSTHGWRVCAKRSKPVPFWPQKTIRENFARNEKLTPFYRAGQVKTAFGNSPAFKFPDVQVAAFKGKVQLSGFVVSEDQKRSAETIAKGIPGLVEVENNISLKH